VKLQPEKTDELEIFAKFARLKIRDLNLLSSVAQSAATARLVDPALSDIISREVKRQELPDDLTTLAGFAFYFSDFSGQILVLIIYDDAILELMEKVP
jgi:hypothetical protein